jgi:hypothetical protein
MLMLSLLAVIKYVALMDKRGEGETCTKWGAKCLGGN